MTAPLDRLRSVLADRYRIEREVGQGGMATVYLARDLKHDREVAIKVLREDLSASLGSGRFLREIKIAAQLQHPNILPLLDSGEADGFLYFVMPYIKGQSLRDRLAREGELPVQEAVRLLTEVADALVLAHEHGVVHRDIKPDNVMLSGRHALVTDFGVAKAISEATGRNTITTLGVAVGTPTYMSPEQAAADPHVDHRSDIYSVGVMAYEMLAGRPPFTGATPQQVLAAHVTQQPDALGRHRPGLPGVLESVIMRCLAKRPADRWQTAGELHTALEPFTTPSGGLTPVDTQRARAPRRRFRVGRGPRLAGAVTGAALAVWAYGHFARKATGTSATTPSRAIAVLPFDNLGRDTAFDYLGDGMASDLRGGLMSLAGLTVKARTSSDAARGKPVKDAGALLGVGVVLQGAFRHATDGTNVTVDLVNVADESALWTGSFVLPADANFTRVQDSITSAVASALHLHSTGGLPTAQVQRGTADAQAYDLYLKGEFLFARRGAANLYRAIDEFKGAIARDSSFARPLAGLAMVYTILPAYTQLPGDSLLHAAEGLARRAIALDSMLVDGHIALAVVLSSQLRVSDAEAQYAVAVALDPRNATGRQWRGTNLNLMGRQDDAIREGRTAAELDPLSAAAATDLAYTLLSAGRFDEAIDVSRRARELDPSLVYADGYIGLAFAFAQKPDSAAQAFDRAFREDSTAPEIRAYQAWGHALSGQWDAAERELATIERTPTASRDLDAAVASLALGRQDAALDALDRAARAHSYYLATAAIGCDPTYNSLKTNPRFIALVKEVGQGLCPARARWPIATPPRRAP